MVVLIRMPLGIEVGVGPGHIVLDGDQAPPKRAPHLSARVYCGQTAGCIKIPLGTKVGLVPGNIVLDGTQLLPPPEKGGQQPPPHFSAHFALGLSRISFSATAELLSKFCHHSWDQ